MSEPTLTESEIFALRQPEPGLLTYYAVSSLVLGPFFLFVFVPLFFRYRTMRYRFDEEGVSMRWGILFRREVHLTYARIQDIHLVSNAVERWLGLARIKIQTASGSAKAEMTIEGVSAFRELRDFLYDRMRGSREQAGEKASEKTAIDPSIASELAATLRAVAEELRALRGALENRTGPGPEDGDA